MTRALVCYFSGNRQLDLSAGAVFAPDGEVCAESFGSLAHAL